MHHCRGGHLGFVHARLSVIRSDCPVPDIPLHLPDAQEIRKMRNEALRQNFSCCVGKRSHRLLGKWVFQATLDHFFDTRL